MNRDRETAILRLILKEKRVSVNDLAERLYASKPSIRRDLASLEGQRLIRRTHGGAELDENGTSEIKIPFLLREMEQSDEKTIIAMRAAAIVPDGSVLFLDASSSAYAMIPYLAGKKNLTVITNGLKALSKLSEYRISAVGTGGAVIASCLAMVGDEALQTVRGYFADFCFFSCRGLSEEGELSDISAAENLVRREMIRRSSSAYLLCTGHKFGKQFYHTLCRAEGLAGVISDCELPPYPGVKPPEERNENESNPI